MMERGKGDGKGNDGQGGRRSEERGTVKGTMDSGQGDDGERKGGR